MPRIQSVRTASVQQSRGTKCHADSAIGQIDAINGHALIANEKCLFAHVDATNE